MRFHTAQHATSRADSYVIRFHERLRVLLRRRNAGDVDDVVQAECEALIVRLARTMAAYPDPYHYASVRAQGGRAVVDHLRRQSVQCGGGAHVFDRDGNRVRGREVVSGGDVYNDPDADHYENEPGKGTYFEVYATRLPDFATQCIEGMAVSDELRRALLRATPAQRTVLLLVDGRGYTVNEAAVVLGLTRETVSRQRSKAYRAIRQQPLQPPC